MVLLMEQAPHAIPSAVAGWVGDPPRSFRATGGLGLVDLAQAARYLSAEPAACAATRGEDPDGQHRRHALPVGGPGRSDLCRPMVAWLEESMPAGSAAPTLESAEPSGTAPGRRT